LDEIQNLQFCIHRHLEVLKWLKINGCELNSLTCSYASLNGQQIEFL